MTEPTKFLRGNYPLEPMIPEAVEATGAPLEADFERAALARLGGSICFVSKRGLLWAGDDAGPGDRPPA